MGYAWSCVFFLHLYIVKVQQPWVVQAVLPIVSRCVPLYCHRSNLPGEELLGIPRELFISCH